MLETLSFATAAAITTAGLATTAIAAMIGGAWLYRPGPGRRRAVHTPVQADYLKEPRNDH